MALWKEKKQSFCTRDEDWASMVQVFTVQTYKKLNLKMCIISWLGRQTPGISNHSKEIQFNNMAEIKINSN